MSTVIKVRCPRCKKLLRVPSENITHSIQCEHCTKSFRVALKHKLAAGSGSIPPRPPVDDDANRFTFGTGGAGDFDLIPVAPHLANYRRRSSALKWAVMGFAAALVAAVGAGIYSQGRLRSNDDDAKQNQSPPTTVASASESAKPMDLPKTATNFPRRFLAVCVHNYLYANSVSSRGERTSMPEVLRRFAKEKLRADPGQIYVLSDALQGKEARPPIKPLIEQTVERFLETARRQDRIILVFVGHAVELDGQPYLVPLEGELTVKDSLIPLKWLYDRLTACRARQKILIVDVCREDPARGNERPASGPMGPKLDAALGSPPPGVQVLSACVAQQFSHEYDYASIGNFDVHGGAFLSLMTQASRTGWGLPKPEDPLPVQQLLDRIKEPLTQLVASRDKAVQTARLAGTELAEPGEGATYEPDAPLAQHFDLPRPAALVEGGLADPQLIRGIFGEIVLPPIKPPRDAGEAGHVDDDTSKLASIVPFRAAALKGYEKDYASLPEILGRAKEFPLRVAVIRAVEALDKLGRSGKGRLMDEFRGQTTDDVKKFITDSQKDGPARLILDLSEARDELEKVANERDKEKSKRWRANYDYIKAEVLARLVYVNEYDLMLGKVKKDELPPLDPKQHNGYRLASQEKIQSPKEIKDYASESRKLLAKVIQENPGTPWELLAKRERFTALGLTWQPANLGQ